MFGFRDNRLRIPEPVTVEWTVEFVTEDDDIRRLIREELAELVPVDVPDAPPEDLR